MSKRLQYAETRYPKLEKLALALVVASRKVRPYFHTHSIEVSTNYPLRQVIQKSKASSKLLKWAIELGQFKVNYHTQTAIKRHSLPDFIVKFTYADAAKVAGMVDIAKVAKVME